jgi:16S rRNA processing protein RimM
MATVGWVARPHGLRGEVVVNPETDFVEERFRAGGVVWARSDRGVEALTVGTVRVQGGRPVIGFAGFARVEDVERLAGLELRVPEAELHPLEPHAYYHHQLVGCLVETVSGARVGAVVRIEGGASGSLLVVDGPRGEILVPLAQAICVDVDVAAGRIVIAPPEGLLDLNEPRPPAARGRRGAREGRQRAPGS